MVIDMSNESIILMLGFLASLISVVKPVLKLNSSITRLNDSVKSLSEQILNIIKIQNESNKRIEDHERRILLIERSK